MLVSGQQPRARTQAQPANSERNRKFKFMASCALPYYDGQSGKIEHGMSCAGCQLALEKDLIGFRGEEWAFEARNKVYTQDGFLEHFKWCKQAQLLWRSSDEGTSKPTELPEAARRGGYFNKREWEDHGKLFTNLLRLGSLHNICRTEGPYGPVPC